MARNLTTGRSDYKLKYKRRGCSIFDRFDAFARPVSLRYPGGEAEFGTCIGGFLSLMAFFVSLLFAMQNLLVVYRREATHLSIVQKESSSSSGPSISPDDGFKIGFFLQGSSTEAQELAKSISFDVKIIGVSSFDKDYEISKEINKCFTTSESQEEDDNNFYDIAEHQSDWLDEVRDELNCIDMKEWKLFGDKHSRISSMLSISVNLDQSLCIESEQTQSDCVMTPANERALADISVVFLKNQ